MNDKVYMIGWGSINIDMSITTITLRLDLPSICDKVFETMNYFLAKILVMEANLCIAAILMEDYGLDAIDNVFAGNQKRNNC